MAAFLIATACGGDQPASSKDQAGAAAPAAAAVTTVSAPAGPVDPTLATRGEQLFQTKGCIGCHTVGGGRLTGPDLAGVTDRREFGWMMAMITNPDSMLRADPTARQLFAEYMTPMANLGVTPDEARALYEFLRK
jgi:mono/diheme cytochrome c family protein